MKLTPSISRVLVICVGLLLFFSAPQASAHPATTTPDLTDSVWKWAESDASFVLTFTQAKPETKGVVAILKGWGNNPLELRGEYLNGAAEPRVRLTGSHEGETITFDLNFNPGDHEQQPFLFGQFSIGSNTYSISAGCDRQCPDISSKKIEELDTLSVNAAAGALVGEWQDDSESIGFKEHWSIKFSNGQWKISGKFIKGEEVVGIFHAGEISFDPKKGVLAFQQVFEQKPDENWLDSNDIEVTAQGNTLNFKVRGVEAALTRKPAGKK